MSDQLDSFPKSRIRTACRRCQQRKIKCGGEFPSCSACQKAGVSCVREGKQEVQRSYIAGIEQRVKWLESLVRESRPDINLDHGRVSATNNIAPNQPVLQQGVTLPSPSSPLRFENLPGFPEEPSGGNVPTQQAEVQLTNPIEVPRHRQLKQAHEIGLVSLSSGGEARYIGPSSGYFFADLRDIKVLPILEVSLLEQEMRTRVFWVIYTLDRTLAILMGRPIGIRDEACELRLPMDISDSQYDVGLTEERSADASPTHITYAIHLFRLARLNSEIKYVMHSICRDPPAYAYPPVRDMSTWQQEMIGRLNDWAADIPINSCSDLAATMAEIRHHEAILLVHRPNPRIPEPSEDSLLVCFHHAAETLRKYGTLYRTDYSPLLYTRLTVHSVFLSTLIMLYAVWKIPNIASQVSKHFEQFMADIKIALNILSSIGEHWLEAKKTRDCVDELSDATVKWLLSGRVQLTKTTSHTNVPSFGLQNPEPSAPPSSSSPAGFDSVELLEDPGSLMSTEWSDLPDFDNLMWEILNFK
ncbi:Transcriptional activator protein acu-15 [Talaromyces islandicus]|uniref:Transcriptional activator protein acu-15 n=1 Tax=Talaromyces islandicus TaxID=28573 RepID=A0A0U1LP06_TALIS|nr:Transcriptional activator protein acu-15 [Talaromyces islandicus]